MVTFVGTQTKLADALRDLMELDYEAKEAYEAAVNRLDNMEYKNQLTQFKKDHQRHMDEISAVLKSKGENMPIMPSMKQWLTKGKVVFANLLGDDTILKAMASNEIDTNTAYERMNERDDLWPEVADIVRRGLRDEHHHAEWLEQAIKKAKNN
ncbi:MAG: ferritin-like domain-containing protein [Alphaproteobacteria bacterium]